MLQYIINNIDNIDIQNIIKERSFILENISQYQNIIKHNSLTIEAMREKINNESGLNLKIYDIEIKNLLEYSNMIKETLNQCQTKLIFLTKQIMDSTTELQYTYLQLKYKFIQGDNINNMFEVARQAFTTRIMHELLQYNLIHYTEFSMDEYLSNPNLNILPIVPETLQTKQEFLAKFLEVLDNHYYSLQRIGSMGHAKEIVVQKFEALYNSFINEQRFNLNIKWRTTIDYFTNEFKDKPLGNKVNRNGTMLFRVKYLHRKIIQGEQTMNENPTSQHLIDAMREANRSAKDSRSYIKLLEACKELE